MKGVSDVLSRKDLKIDIIGVIPLPAATAIIGIELFLESNIKRPSGIPALISSPFLIFRFTYVEKMPFGTSLIPTCSKPLIGDEQIE